MKAGKNPAGANKKQGDKPAWAGGPRPVDYTPLVLDFLKENHGRIRQDNGDYFFSGVSAISLHLLLSSGLPAKELLWRWYRHFDNHLSESIYQSLPPLRDEEFLHILSECDFHLDQDQIRESGLVFLARHRASVMAVVEETLSARLEAYRAMDDETLREVLTPKNTRTAVHLRRLVRKLKTDPVSPEQRRGLYTKLESDYQRATARQLLEEAAVETFWNAPPPELEALTARLKVLYKTLMEHSMRLGVYATQADIAGEHYREYQRKARSARGRKDNFPGSVKGEMEAHHYAMLGLKTNATLGQVRAAYREKVKTHHPDQGGSMQEFLRVQEAYEYLVSSLE